MRFDEKHADINRKHPSTVSLKIVLACTKEMAILHLDDLAAELISTGIFTNATQIEPGVWEGSIDTSRIYNHDETPQFVRYGTMVQLLNWFTVKKVKSVSNIYQKIVNVSLYTHSYHLMDPLFYVTFFSRQNL